MIKIKVKNRFGVKLDGNDNILYFNIGEHIISNELANHFYVKLNSIVLEVFNEEKEEKEEKEEINKDFVKTYDKIQEDDYKCIEKNDVLKKYKKAR